MRFQAAPPAVRLYLVSTYCASERRKTIGKVVKYILIIVVTYLLYQWLVAPYFTEKEPGVIMLPSPQIVIPAIFVFWRLHHYLKKLFVENPKLEKWYLSPDAPNMEWRRASLDEIRWNHVTHKRKDSDSSVWRVTGHEDKDIQIRIGVGDGSSEWVDVSSGSLATWKKQSSVIVIQARTEMKERKNNEWTHFFFPGNVIDI